jgi:hypothetical protein
LKRKVALVIALIFSVLVLSFGTAIYYYNHNNKTEPKFIPRHPPMYTTTMSTLNSEVDNIGTGMGRYDNVSQGTPFQVNLTFTSITTQKKLITIENLTVCYYNSTVDRHKFIASDKSYPVIQALAFNYSFSLNPVVLQPYMSNSTILTINLADDAPLGQYTLAIHTARIIENGISYSGSFGLEMIVTPKGT